MTTFLGPEVDFSGPGMRRPRGTRKTKKEYSDMGMCSKCTLRPKAPNRKMCRRCLDQHNVLNKKYAAKFTPEQKAHRKANYSAWKDNNRPRVRELSREHVDRTRDQVIKAYGGCCTCCGESGRPFLSLDHINGDGAAHRKMLMEKFGWSSIVGSAFYKWVLKNGFPDFLQILCHNCNCAKRTNKKCPHQMSKAHPLQADLFDWQPTQ